MTIDDPLSDFELDEETVKRVQTEMLAWYTELEAKAYMYGQPKDSLTTRVGPGATVETLRVTMDLSLRELMARNQRDILVQVAQDMVHQLKVAVRDELDRGRFTDLIHAELKAEIKKQVKEAVAGRIDDFVEEALG